MKSKKSKTDGTRQIAANRKAFHDYFILEKLETGIALVGSELRPCREGKVTIKDAYAEVTKGELWLYDMHIGANSFANRNSHEPERKRKLLAHRNQIDKLGDKCQTTGITIVPLRLYFKNGKVKVEVALVKGKTKYDKRASIAKKDAQRDMERELGGRY